MRADTLALLIPLSFVWGIILLGALAILKGKSRNRGAGDPEETRMIQDIYHGLMKMEERVEALETLMVDQERKGGVR